MKYLEQKKGTCCFVYAVANCTIYLKRQVSIRQFKKACKIALCQHGGAIRHKEVVEFLQVPLIETRDENKVFEYGGILNIMHPIYNGHSFFLFPQEKQLTLVNSWLGPNVMRGIGIGEISPFTNIQYGTFWRLERKYSKHKVL
tara:strand:- start:685 stop:1113 length:429 start_codon:yes stop_codon:yes gene_type:complete